MLPTRTRFTVLRFTFALSIITYIDRVCISTAAPTIRSELQLTPSQMGWVFSAFTLAYAVFEVPTGWLGDVIGPRKVLTRIVLWWSAFTMASGGAWNYISLVTARFLFGVGEAGAFPNMSRSLAQWFPARERGAAHGVIFMGSRLGGALTPPVVVLIIGLAGWRQSFWIFGSLGIVWSILWWKWFRDDPAQHPSVNAAELQLIRESAESPQQHFKLQWRSLLSLNLLWICLMYFCYGYSLYFYLTWMPTYLRDARGFSGQQVGLIHGFILLAAAGASILGGRLTDWLVKRYGLRIGRSIGTIAMPASGLALIGAALTNSGVVSAILLAAAAAAGDLCLSPAWAICHDVGKDAAGTVTGSMNTFGNLGGTLSPLVVGYAVQWWGSWSIPLIIAAVISIVGGGLTLLIDPRKDLI